MVDGLHRRQNSTAHSMLAFVPTDLSNLQNLLLAPCCTVPGRIDRTDSTPALNHDNTDSANVALPLSHELGEGTIKSTTADRWVNALRSEEHTSELQSLMRSSYAVFCW